MACRTRRCALDHFSFRFYKWEELKALIEDGGAGL